MTAINGVKAMSIESQNRDRKKLRSKIKLNLKRQIAALEREAIECDDRLFGIKKTWEYKVDKLRAMGVYVNYDFESILN